MMTIATGTRLGRYEIRSQLGAGGMGELCRASETKLNREVAFKVLPVDRTAAVKFRVEAWPSFRFRGRQPKS